MNESDFEAKLRRLAPAAPSASLEGRIAAGLESRLVATVPSAGVIVPMTRSDAARSPRWKPLWRNLSWAALGAAATLTVVTVWPEGADQSATTGASVAVEAAQKPVEAADADASAFELESTERELLAKEEPSEVIYADDQEPAQYVRYSSLERHAWTNRATGARVEVEIPREDLLLVPVSYQ